MAAALSPSWSRLTLVQKLIAVNVAVFLVVYVPRAVFGLFNIDLFNILPLYNWLAVPAALPALLSKPWTLFTYMFMHGGVMHILFNMLWLFWMGNIFLEYLGPQKLLSVYILGGLSGAILYITAFNIFPLFSQSINGAMVGASASVLAITVGIATLIPEYSLRLLLFGNVPLKYLAAGTLALDLLSISSDSNPGGHIAHLGGALYGFFYVRKLKKGTDLAAGFNRLLDRLSSLTKRRPAMRTHTQRRHAVSDEDYLAGKKIQQEEIDRILDKISRSGYGSLTQKEKDILFKSSKEE